MSAVLFHGQTDYHTQDFIGRALKLHATCPPQDDRTITNITHTITIDMQVYMKTCLNEANTQ